MHRRLHRTHNCPVPVRHDADDRLQNRNPCACRPEAARRRRSGPPVCTPTWCLPAWARRLPIWFLPRLRPLRKTRRLRRHPAIHPVELIPVTHPNPNPRRHQQRRRQLQRHPHRRPRLRLHPRPIRILQKTLNRRLLLRRYPTLPIHRTLMSGGSHLTIGIPTLLQLQLFLSADAFWRSRNPFSKFPPPGHSPDNSALSQYAVATPTKPFPHHVQPVRDNSDANRRAPPIVPV